MRILVLILSAWAMACVSYAQPKMDPFDLHVASLRILEDRRVQAEIGITQAQRGMMDQFANNYNGDLKTYVEKLKKEGKDPSKMTGPDDTMLNMLSKLKQNVMGVLNSGQLKRLREVSLQAFALNGLLDSVVAKRVGIGDQQLAKMRATFEEGSKKANAIVQKALDPVNVQFRKMSPKTDAERKSTAASYEQKQKAALDKVEAEVVKVREATRQKILGMITAKQKSTFLALQGKPFKPAPSQSSAAKPKR